MKTTHSLVLNNANGVGERKIVSQGEGADQIKDVNQKQKVKKKEKPMMAIMMTNKSKDKRQKDKSNYNSQFLSNFLIIFKLFKFKHLYYFVMYKKYKLITQ